MYDVIIVGARCAGSPLAMLLARNGLHVLLVDKAEFPSDTLSTHLLHPPAIDALRRWGLFAALDSVGAPRLDKLVWRYQDIEVSGFPWNPYDVDHVYAPRRYAFDLMLLEEAIKAGAEFRSRFVVDDLVVSRSGSVVGVQGHGPRGQRTIERASLVIGADGVRSVVANKVGAATLREDPGKTCSYYSYWADLDKSEIEMWPGFWTGYGILPTNNGLTTVSVGFPRSRFDEVRKDAIGNFMAVIRTISPDFAEKLDSAERTERLYGMVNHPNYIRQRYGDGWALAGDAACHKDPITAGGITDALLDAEALSVAILTGLDGTYPLAQALGQYETQRNTSLASFFDMTVEAASLTPPDEPTLEYMRALQKNRTEADRYFSVGSYVLPTEQVLTPDRMSSVIQGAG